MLLSFYVCVKFCVTSCVSCKSLALFDFLALHQSKVMNCAGKFYDKCFDSFVCLIVLRTCQDVNACYLSGFAVWE